MNDAPTAPDTSVDFSSKAAQLKCMFEDLCACASCATANATSAAACQAKNQAVEAGHKFVKTVRWHPWKAIVIAIGTGTGLLVWWLANRRGNSAEL